MKASISMFVSLAFNFDHTFMLATGHYALYKKLFVDQDYNPDLRPVQNVSQAVGVELDYRMTSVDDLDETNEFLSSTAWLKMQWKDEFLRWNKSEFNNVSRISLPATQLWGPDLVLNNDHGNTIRITKEDSMVILFSNGTVAWWVPANWRTKCRVDVSKFPFDSQSCPIEIAQYTSNNASVSINGNASRKLGKLFNKHGEWKVTNLFLDTTWDDYDGEHMSRITVYVVLTRRPLYHIITYMLPVVALSVLNLATFLVPVESGEKISLCVSVLLSYAVFLSSITSSLPKISDTVSIFGIYLLVMLIVKVASCFVAVVVVKVHNTKEMDCHKVTPTTSTSDGSPENRAARINYYSSYLILSLTIVITVAFFSVMTIQ